MTEWLRSSGPWVCFTRSFVVLYSFYFIFSFFNSFFLLLQLLFNLFFLSFSIQYNDHVLLSFNFLLSLWVIFLLLLLTVVSMGILAAWRVICLAGAVRAPRLGAAPSLSVAEWEIRVSSRLPAHNQIITKVSPALNTSRLTPPPPPPSARPTSSTNCYYFAWIQSCFVSAGSFSTTKRLRNLSNPSEVNGDHRNRRCNPLFLSRRRLVTLPRMQTITSSSEELGMLREFRDVRFAIISAYGGPVPDVNEWGLEN